VKKNCKGTSFKSYLLFIFILLLMIGSLISYSYGREGETVKWGVSVFGGTGEATRNKPHISVYGFLPRIDLALHTNWDLEFEGNYSNWNISTEKDLYFLGANANILFKPIRRNWGSLFLLAGGGLGYDNANKSRVSEIGASHCGGILQAGAGIYYNLGKRWALREEYRFYHISDPFRKDLGLNTHIFLLGIYF
jgi:opacity protein-like surface antigen